MQTILLYLIGANVSETWTTETETHAHAAAGIRVSGLGNVETIHPSSERYWCRKVTQQQEERR